LLAEKHVILTKEVSDMKRIAISIFCFAALFLGLSGCINHQIVPPLEQLEPSRLPEITTKDSVAVIAVYNPTAAMIRFCDGGAHRYFGKIDDLTDSAVKNLEAMLKQKNIVLDAKAVKRFSIAVISARCSGVPPYGLSYYVTILVKTGNGVTRTFTGHNVGGHIFGTDTHVSHAINEAYLDMFYNDEIKDYLKN
jgi:hypothetical protein